MQSLGIYGAPRTNQKVIEAWQRGVSARNHKFCLTSVSHPNGHTELYSYDLKIGEKTPGGVFIIADFTAATGGFYSMTTSCHVNLAKRLTGNSVIMHPKVWEHSPASNQQVPF
jgi:hypothetical protein